ncbi:MAG: M15 family metallopeptidase [Defluviitaleaceae bacterium]|nr:M15 family metallopeptidase [Defluviitaleaceae bacterium]
MNNMNRSNKQRKYPVSGRQKRRRRNYLRGVIFGLLTGIALSTIVFLVSMQFINANSNPITQVFAGDDVAVWAENDQNYAEALPGWLGELPEGSPDIGIDTAYTYETLSPIAPGQEIYAVFSFYIAENAQAYLDFHAENPGMNPETVVWKVNAFLHLPFYSHILVNYDPNPLLVNPSHRLPYGFVPAILVPVYENNPNLLATPETTEAFRQMRTSINRAGMDIAVTSAYRTAERQRILFDRQTGDGFVARPYHSEHQTGRALDLWGPGRSGLLDGEGGPPSREGLWIAENAHNYGFIVRYTVYNTHITSFIPEPWHITYVTTDIAQHIHQSGILSLEEFVARYPEIRMNISSF